MKKRYGIFLLLFIAYILLEAAVIGKGYYSVSADDSGRSIIAYNLLHGKMPDDLDWLPLHSIINAGALYICNDLFWTPRVISLLFGLLSAAALGYLSYQLFQNQKSFALTILFAVFYPPHIMFSAVPLTEIMFAFFIAEAMALFTSWYRTKKNRLLYLSALFFTLSAGIRYEGWMFSFAFLLTLILVFRKELSRENIKTLFIAFSITAVIPLIWMTIHLLYYGNPIYFITGPQNLYQKLTGNSILLRLKYNFITNFVFQILFFFIFPGLIYLIAGYKKDSMTRYFFYIWAISIIIIAALSISGYGNPSHAFWRIPFTWTYLLIPFLAHLLFIFSKKDVFTTTKRWFIIFVPLPLFFIAQTYFLTEYSPFTKAEKHTGEYIRMLLKDNPKSKVLIETSNWNYLHVLAASGYPDRFTYDTHEKNIRPHPFTLSGKHDDSHSIINKNGIKYIVVYGDNPDKKISSHGLKKLKSFSGWTIFSVR
jgi:hypothetical protein